MPPSLATETLDVNPLTDEANPVRTRLLLSAAEVFAEKGYDGARVGEIARRAGLTTGAIYANFSGKAELLLEAIHHLSAFELDELVLAIASGESGPDAIIAMGSELATRDLDGREPLLLEALVAVRRDQGVRDAMRTLVEQREAVFAGLVEQARALGEVDEDVDVRAVTRFCFALAFGFLLFEALDFAHPDPTEWAALIRRLVDSIRPTGSSVTTTSSPPQPAKASQTPGEQP